MKHYGSTTSTLGALFVVGMAAPTIASATEPCGDLGECKALIEINSSDGDVGFHFLMDGGGFIRGNVYDPNKRKIFQYAARRDLRRQTVTELFTESAEPLCWFDPDADPDELDDVVTLKQFVRRWDPGTYHFVGIDKEWEMSFGETALSFALPAAPVDIEYEEERERDGDGEVDVVGEISWERGHDLGNCAEIPDDEEGDDPNVPNLSDVMAYLDAAPADVPIAVWEVVVEADFEEDDPNSALGLKYVSRIPGDAELEVEVPSDFLEALPTNTPIKIEIGAIGFDDNATFTEIGDICLNEKDPDRGDNLDGCGFELDGEDD